MLAPPSLGGQLAPHSILELGPPPIALCPKPSRSAPVHLSHRPPNGDKRLAYLLKRSTNHAARLVLAPLVLRSDVPSVSEHYPLQAQPDRLVHSAPVVRHLNGSRVLWLSMAACLTVCLSRQQVTRCVEQRVSSSCSRSWCAHAANDRWRTRDFRFGQDCV